jgi:ubiquinone/menaquinone biosynthesis C-methylase UbiE
MPTIEDNLWWWEKGYDWRQQGEEWSAPWTTEFLWWGTLLPRIHAFVPTGTILEIAPGFGRVTQYLKDLCTSLIVVDIAERCIEACKQRFSSCSHITYHINDGKSLEMIPDQSVDFVMSFDSLVYADSNVIEAYLSQLARKLKPNGVGFIHHSNLGSYALFTSKWLPLQLRKKILHAAEWQDASMTARLFERFCEQAGLQCIAQELIDRRARMYPRLTGCLSLFTQKDSVWSRPNKVFRNPKWTQEGRYLAKLARFYPASIL